MSASTACRRPPARCSYSKPSCTVGACECRGHHQAKTAAPFVQAASCSPQHAVRVRPAPRGVHSHTAVPAAATTCGQKQKLSASSTSRYWARSSGRPSSKKCSWRSNEVGEKRGAAPAREAASRWTPAVQGRLEAIEEQNVTLWHAACTASRHCMCAAGAGSGGGSSGGRAALPCRPARCNTSRYSAAPCSSMETSWAWESTHSAELRTAAHGSSSSLPDMTIK